MTLLGRLSISTFHKQNAHASSYFLPLSSSTQEIWKFHMINFQILTNQYMCILWSEQQIYKHITREISWENLGEYCFAVYLNQFWYKTRVPWYLIIQFMTLPFIKKKDQLSLSKDFIWAVYTPFVKNAWNLDWNSTWGLKVIIRFKVEIPKETSSSVKVSATQLQDADIMRQLAHDINTLSILQEDAISDANNGSTTYLEWQFTSLAVNTNLL